MKKILVIFVFTMLPMLAFSEIVEIDGICYNLLPKGNAAEVAAKSGGYSGDITIPGTITYNDEIYKVTSIANSAFRGARVNSVNLPNSITYIGEWAFYGCSFTTFIMPNSVKSTGIYAFSGCSNLKIITLSNQLNSISGYVLAGCNNLVSIDIPESVTSIGYLSFGDCTALKTIEIPNSVTEISACAFEGCSKLLSISLSKEITYIGGYSFYGCTNLNNVSIPDKVSSVGGYAFHGCSNLESIVLGSNMNYLDDNAFSSCAKLKDVYCYALTPPSIKEKTFEGSYPEYITLHVPAASIESYRSTEPWSQFKAIVALESGDTPTVEKCATPTISFENGKIKFNCETEGVEYISEITTNDTKKYYDGEIKPSFKYKVTVYATKAGYENSDTATMEITASGKLGDLNADGKVDAADHVKLSDIIMNQNE